MDLEENRTQEGQHPLDAAADENGVIISPEKFIEATIEKEELDRYVKSINDFPKYQPEEENPDILIRGRWLERGGSAWWISTAGTGKSIASVQLAYLWGAGIDFAGLAPHRPIKSWIIQSEDSPSRIVIDRDDIVAELTERIPEVAWTKVGEEQVKFVKISGKVGTAFLEELDRLLRLAAKHSQKPDVIIINPFMAVVGGPVSDGGYVTPFLRGGEIEHRHTDGLQCLLERHSVATLIFHHTPKPPTEKELDGWLKSMFPEYQGAGSSDITNWGRSFITMMRVKGHPRMVCIIAGKNGSEIGWEEIGGVRRKYMAWSDAIGVTGGERHAWRELTEEECDAVIGALKSEDEKTLEEIADQLAEDLKRSPSQTQEIEERLRAEYTRKKVRNAWSLIRMQPSKYHITIVRRLIGGSWTEFVGLADAARNLAELAEQNAKVKSIKAQAERSNNGRGMSDNNAGV